MVIASEDVGLAYPQAAAIVNACVDNANRLGLPEARLPLAQAVILLATAPKSNAVIEAVDSAMNDVRTKNYGDIPSHIKDSHYSGAKKMSRGLTYKYTQLYKNNYTAQQYLPDNLKNAKYYRWGTNKAEQAAKAYWDKVIAEDKGELR